MHFKSSAYAFLFLNCIMIKMKFYILPILILLTVSSQSQSDLNLQTNYGYKFADGRAIVETSDYYLAIGRNSKDSLGRITGIHFSLHDKKTLKVVKSYTYDSDTILFSLQENNFILQKNDSIYQIIDDGVGPPYTLKVLETNIYSGKTSLILSNNLVDFNFLSSSFVFKKTTYSLATSFGKDSSAFCVIHTLNEKNFTNIYTFKTPQKKEFYGYALNVFNDSTLILVGFSRNNIKDIEEFYAILIHLKTMKILQNNIFTPSFNLGYISEGIMINGDTMFLCGSRVKKFPDDHRLKNQPCVFSYSISKNKVLNMEYFGDTTKWNVDGTYNALLKSKDGNIVYGGRSYYSYGEDKGETERGVV
ncbi:MAG: hypothetical protein RLZZ546_2786, partial [Bacteroidota bacterium]